MKNLSLDNIARAVGGKYVGPEEKKKTEIKNAAIDSRKIEKDGLFIATVGARVDGHSFIKQVMEKGALCVIAQRDLTSEDFPKGIKPCYIKVDDSFEALKKLAAFYRQQLNIKVVGITGSVGKTSTKEMIAGVLSAKYNVLKTQGNFNNEVGLPLTVLSIREEHEVAVLEMGISDFGEMTRLTSIARPDICVITNIGQCHLENLKSRDGILKAKTEIFQGMSSEGYAVLNGKDDKLATIKDVAGKKPFFTYSAECYAENIVNKGIFGSECDIIESGEKIHAVIHVPGVHQIDNALVAVRVAKLLGLTKDEMEKGIACVETIGGRNHIIKGQSYVLIDDCYNANPVSMKAALSLLSMADSRKVAVLGDMFELGENENKLHEGVGEYAVDKADVLICIGQLAHYIYEGAMAMKGDADIVCLYYKDKEAFLMQKDNVLQKGDTILIKASHGMAFETMLETLEK